MNWILTVTYLVGTGDEATKALNHSNTKERADKWLSDIVGRIADRTAYVEGHGELRQLHWDDIPEGNALVFSKLIQERFDLPCSIKLTCVGNAEEISEAEKRMLSKAIRVLDLNIDVPESTVTTYVAAVEGLDWTPGGDEPMGDQFPVIPSD